MFLIIVTDSIPYWTDLEGRLMQKSNTWQSARCQWLNIFNKSKFVFYQFNGIYFKPSPCQRSEKLDIQTDLLTVWMCYFCDVSVTNKLFSQWCLAFVALPLNVAKVLFPWSPCHHLLLVTELHPSSPWTSWMETQLHLIHFWFSFFFFLSLCSTPLLSFSLCCVLISPTPLLCHQLGPLVSKSWSHCACSCSFSVFDHAYVCMYYCGIPQTHSSN